MVYNIGHANTHWGKVPRMSKDRSDQVLGFPESKLGSTILGVLGLGLTLLTLTPAAMGAFLLLVWGALAVAWLVLAFIWPPYQPHRPSIARSVALTILWVATPAVTAKLFLNYHDLLGQFDMRADRQSVGRLISRGNTLQVRVERVNTMGIVTTQEETQQLVDDTNRWLADVESWLDSKADSANAEDFRTLTGDSQYKRLPEGPERFGFSDGIRKRVRWLRMLNKSYGAIGDVPADYN